MPSFPANRSFERSSELQARLHDLIPGGAHAYSRGSDQYPEHMTPVLVRGHGCRVWDADDNEYIEYGMGLRAVTLGHGFRPVVEAVCSAIANGANFTRPTVLELAAAEDFLGLVPGADMVKFAKNGSDVTTAAVRLARAATGRVKVAACEQPSSQPMTGSSSSPLAAKHRSTVTTMARKYQTTIVTPHGRRRCFKVSVDNGPAT